MKDGIRGLVQSLARKRSGEGVGTRGRRSSVGSSKKQLGSFPSVRRPLQATSAIAATVLLS